MDKFIQLPFTIPPTSTEKFSGYIDWLSETKPFSPSSISRPSIEADDFKKTIVKAEEKNAPSIGGGSAGSEGFDVDAPKPTPNPEAVAFAETRDVGAIVRAITNNSIGNPREMKRMINLARFYLALRSARRVSEPEWRAPAPQQYARWIAVNLRWPDMMRWLQWGADEATWVTGIGNASLIVRRLSRLEEVGKSATTLEGWKNNLQADLNVPISSESDWACDPKLFEFFKAENNFAPPERLSAAAARGFC